MSWTLASARVYTRHDLQERECNSAQAFAPLVKSASSAPNLTMFMCYITDCGQLERGVPCKSHPVLTLMPWDSDSYAMVRYLALKLSPGLSISESQICHSVSPQRTKLKELSNHAPKPLHHSRGRPNRLSHHRTPPDQHDLLRETEIHHRPHPEPLLPKM